MFGEKEVNGFQTTLSVLCSLYLNGHIAGNI